MMIYDLMGTVINISRDGISDIGIGAPPFVWQGFTTRNWRQAVSLRTGRVRAHARTEDAAQIGISQSQVFTTARGFAGKKKHGKKRERLFSSGKRCIYCDTKFRATGRKIICVTQRNRFSIRNTFCFRAVLLRPWSRAPSLSSRPKNARFACRYRPPEARMCT